MGQVAGAGQEPDWRPWDAVVASRAVLTVAEGLGARFHQAVSPRGAARTPAWRAAAGALAALDLAKGAWLSGHDRFRGLPRWVGDAADLALWCAAAADDWDSSEDAVVPGVALACEAGARLGPVGVVVPLANAGVAAAVRRRRGHELRLPQLSWQLMGSLGGWALRSLAERGRTALERRHRADRQALFHRAELAGFHDLIVEHEGVVDLLQRATTLVELAAPGGSVRSFAGAMKAAVAETARGQAVYLADALSAWQVRHNQRPDLASVVELPLPAGAGLLLISPDQAEALGRLLDGMDLAGTAPVEVVSPTRAERPFADLRLRVAGHDVELPGEGSPPRWLFDATPVAFLMNIGWLSQPTGAHREAVAWRATAGPMAASLVAALWSARLEAANRPISPAASVAVSGAVTLAYTVAACRSMRHPHTDEGVSRFPWVMPLQGYELVRSIPSQSPSPSARALGRAGTALIVATGWRLSPRPRSARALVAELGWVVAFDAFTRRLRRATLESGERLSAQIGAHDRNGEREAYERGRARARELVEQALAEARRDLDRRAPDLPADLRAEACRRLDRVADALVAG